MFLWGRNLINPLCCAGVKVISNTVCLFPHQCLRKQWSSSTERATRLRRKWWVFSLSYCNNYSVKIKPGKLIITPPVFDRTLHAPPTHTVNRTPLSSAGSFLAPRCRSGWATRQVRQPPPTHTHRVSHFSTLAALPVVQQQPSRLYQQHCFKQMGKRVIVNALKFSVRRNLFIFTPPPNSKLI